MTEFAGNNLDLIEITADIVAAYVSNNSIEQGKIPNLISEVHAALTGLGTVKAAEPEPTKLVPAVPVKKSITDEFLICLEDGKKFKSLKRHLNTKYDMTPAEYRLKWNLPADYPMVAPSYAKARSDLAKNMGLGQKRRKTKRSGSRAG